jgi:HD-GYP domain-containing protein (c-di-GMP phosphodiesterase class II)
MQDYVREQASNAIHDLVGRTRILAEERGLDTYAAFRQALAERVNNPLRRRSGDFVYAGFFEPGGAPIAETRDGNHPNLDEVERSVIERPLREPAPDESVAESIEVNGQPYIYVVIPVKDRDEQVAAYTHGIFALSEAAQLDFAQRIWRSVFLAALIVIATAGLLYPVILRLMNRLSHFSSNLLEANLESLALLGGTIAKRDSDTDAHNYRVTIYAVKLAQAIRLETQQIRALIKGAFLHDVGKIGIRDNILLKPGRLDEDEFKIMKTHVNHGLDVVSRSVWLEDAVHVVGSHHEKYDGSGYPVARKGDQIPAAARIFAIVDVFDALTSKRPYKEPMSFEKTMGIIREGSGSHFDPDLVEAFEKIADQLYRDYCGREDEGLHKELDEIVRHYFSTEVKSLL